MAMQIAVTYQKTKWIRPACLDAGSGNQGTKIATAAAAAPTSAPMTRSWAIDPLRKAAETTQPRGSPSGEAAPGRGKRNTCYERDSAAPKSAPSPLYISDKGSRSLKPRRTEWV